MNIEYITQIVKSYIDASIDNREIENPKIDFKREWYNLSEEDGKSEFCKDVSAIANTVGLDGYLIIGYDSNKNTFHNCKISQSNKSDIDIKNLLNKYISEDIHVNLYDIKIENNFLVVIHIPPQFNKPFVLKNYKKKGKDDMHRIFVRKASSNVIATKYDLDFIYYDKKNLVPEIGFNIFLQNFNISPHIYGFGDVSLSLVIENYGIKPIAIQQISITLTALDEIIDAKINTNSSETSSIGIFQNPLLINPGHMEKYPSLRGTLHYDNKSQEKTQKISEVVSELNEFTLKINLVNGLILDKKVVRSQFISE